MKVVFLGTPKFVDPVLNVLNKNFDVVAAIRNPKDFDSLIVNCDLLVVASFGKILTKEILDAPKYGAINLHPSLLPIYRGSTPIQSAIINGDKKTGISIIKMDEKIDHGPILYQKEEDIRIDDTFESLAERLFKLAANGLPETISSYISNKTSATVQDDSRATFTKILTRNDGEINISKLPDYKEFDRKVRAFYPWPGVWIQTKIDEKREKIVKFLPKKKVQVEGKKEVNYKDFINGYPNADSRLVDFLKNNG